MHIERIKTMDVINEVIKHDGKLYLLNSFDDVAIRFEVGKDGNKVIAYTKPLGKKERRVNYPDAFDSAQGAEQISKEQYDQL